jgi:hypothetical protein
VSFPAENPIIFAFRIGTIAAVVVGGSGTCWTLSFLRRPARDRCVLGSYPHFLRLRIKGDRLTIYPVVCSKAPQSAFDYREGHQGNPIGSKNSDMPRVHCPKR